MVFVIRAIPPTLLVGRDGPEKSPSVARCSTFRHWASRRSLYRYCHFLPVVQATAESVQKRDRAPLHLAWAPTTPTPLAGPWIFATFDNKTPPAQPAAAVVSTGTYGQLDNVPSPCTSVQMSFLACHSPLVFIPVPQRPRPRSAGNLAPSVSHSPWPPAWTLM
ncbi:hypothetical protein L1887_61697 [Cichorium endivia]|nr:hypothetical protein L1887_61697 [Cichorium endivia]